jgi:hypothetical protein
MSLMADSTRAGLETRPPRGGFLRLSPALVKPQDRVSGLCGCRPVCSRDRGFPFDQALIGSSPSTRRRPASAWLNMASACWYLPWARHKTPRSFSSYSVEGWSALTASRSPLEKTARQG